MTSEDAAPVEIGTETQLASFLDQHDRAVVEFATEWCGPCVTVEIFLQEATDGTDAGFAQVDVEELPAVAEEYGVTASPTVLSFVDGEAQAVVRGMADREVYADLVEGTADASR